jgi:hypothetical protein
VNRITAASNEGSGDHEREAGQIRLNGAWRCRQERKDLRNLDKEFERILDEDLTVVQKANDVISFVDFYNGLRENLNKARLMKNKRNS